MCSICDSKMRLAIKNTLIMAKVLLCLQDTSSWKPVVTSSLSWVKHSIFLQSQLMDLQYKPYIQVSFTLLLPRTIQTHCFSFLHQRLRICSMVAAPLYMVVTVNRVIFASATFCKIDFLWHICKVMNSWVTVFFITLYK